MAKLAIIPARGGSKRIPRKNIKPFLGKPIIAYSIEAALKSGLFDEVMVSTDDEEIAKIARKYGAKVPFYRSKDNSGDYATTLDVIKEVIDSYKKIEKSFVFATCIYPTAPFVNEGILREAYNLLVKESYDCVFPVMEYSFPIQRAIRVDRTNSKMEMFNPNTIHTRSQDLESSYHDSGQFYYFKPEIILEKQKLWTNNTGVIIINEMEGQDIDTETDWEIAELKYKMMIDGEETNLI
jgi:N-acylneuraminate cytidylyltransferase